MFAAAGGFTAMAHNENDSPPKQMAAKLLARDCDKALGIACEQWRRTEKLGDSAAADAWRRIARAIVLIELEHMRRMLDDTSEVTGSEKVVRRAVTTTKDVARALRTLRDSLVLGRDTQDGC